MTRIEFSNEFDILFDNIASKGAPGLDLYEKSVYLTKAQLELIKAHYSPDNKYRKAVEGSEKRRIDLKELIKHFNNTSALISSNGISNDSKFFSIPDNVFLILQESAIIDSCSTHKSVEVKPKTYDEYNIQIKNPFKRPNGDLVWRLDFSRQSDSQNVELISPHNILKYQIRYIKYPSPIILVNLDDGEFSGQGLSIDGQITPQTCELHQSFHPEILDRAVQLAVRDYDRSKLQSKIQLDQRNE